MHGANLFFPMKDLQDNKKPRLLAESKANVDLGSFLVLRYLINAGERNIWQTTISNQLFFIGYFPR